MGAVSSKSKRVSFLSASNGRHTKKEKLNWNLSSRVEPSNTSKYQKDRNPKKTRKSKFRNTGITKSIIGRPNNFLHLNSGINLMTNEITDLPNMCPNTILISSPTYKTGEIPSK